MLQTETNTPAMGARVLRAAKRILKTRTATAHFEHGQWWILLPSGAAYSVVDAEGCGTVDGFDLEQVSQGEEE
jgi:hypothetical protein